MISGLNRVAPMYPVYPAIQHRICAMELYQFQTNPFLGLREAPKPKEKYGLLKMKCEGFTGWVEFTFPESVASLDLVRWAAVFVHLKGLTIEEAHEWVQCKHEQWGDLRFELAEKALLDLAQKFAGATFVNMSRVASTEPSTSQLIEYSQSYYSF